MLSICNNVFVTTTLACNCSHVSKGKSDIWIAYEERDMEDSSAVRINDIWDVKKNNGRCDTLYPDIYINKQNI